jgi:topoisomerase-4 subunit B
VIAAPIVFKGSANAIESEIAMTYIDDFSESVLGFANNVKTVDGGTHITGFKSGLLKALNEYARKNNLLKERDKKLDANDVKEGLIAIVSVKIPEDLIQYEGQTKGKLGTSEAKAACEEVTEQGFAFWLLENNS